MIAGCTATARFFSSSNQYAPEIEWMLPSNRSPTRRPSAARSALPELPPTMSLFVERLNGVVGSSRAARSASSREAERRLLRRAHLRSRRGA
jgi:hypothetical protein